MITVKMAAIVAIVALLAGCSSGNEANETATAVDSTSPTSAATTRGTASEGEPDASFLFVMSGTSTSIDGETLTMSGVPGVLAFTDRPERMAGFIALDDAEAGVAAYRDDPPNAVLSVLSDEVMENVAVELTSLTDEGDGAVSIGFRPISASSPPTGEFGPTSLFIDSVPIPECATGGGLPIEEQCLLALQLAIQNGCASAGSSTSGLNIPQLEELIQEYCD